MARPYSDKFVIGLENANPKRLGIQLAKLCVKANLPATHVADTFGVSRQTIHNWFRGSAIRHRHLANVENYIEILEESLAEGSLPAPTLAHAKVYLESHPKLNVR
jgi:DNA-binding XRE family transcriptional regulator